MSLLGRLECGNRGHAQTFEGPLLQLYRPMLGALDSGVPMTLDEFFAGRDESRQLFEAVRRAVDEIGPAELRVTKSQVAFRRRKAFAWVWIPSQYLRRQTAPLVLTVGLRYRDASPRWKSIVEPYPGRFTHHLELYAAVEVDEEVRRWLREAWAAADRGSPGR